MDYVIELELARVTEEGLLFNNHFYSSPQLLKDRWFEKAREEGEWIVPILINKDLLNEIILVRLEPALKIEKSADFNNEIQQTYFEAIQHLKEQLYIIRKKSDSHHEK